MSKILTVFKTKKFLVIMLSVLLVAGLATAIAVTATGNPELTVSSPSIYYDGDRQVTVTVSLPADDTYLIAGAGFILGYDPTVISCSVDAQGRPIVSWNISDGIKTTDLISVNEHLSYISFVWVNTDNISYLLTNDESVKFVSVVLTVADNAPAGEYPLTLSPLLNADGDVIKICNAAGDEVPTDLVSGKLTINPIPITYTASITGLNGNGEAVYGTTLGASASAIEDARAGNDTTYTEAEISHFTYQWYRGDDPISGATNATYSPTTDDIAASDDGGSILSVTIGASGNYTNPGVSTGKVKAVRAVYTGVVPAPVLVSRTATSITVGISDANLQTSDCDFRMGAEGDWQSDPTFTDLTNTSTYTVYARVKKTSTHNFSDSSVASDAMKVQLPASGTLTLSDAAPAFGDTLTAVTTELDSNFAAYGLGKATYTWYRDVISAANVAGTGASYTVAAADIGHTLTLVINANDDYTDYLWGYTGTVTSAATLAAVKADNNATPTAPLLISNDQVNTGGLLIEVVANQEYKIIQGSETVSDWTSYAGLSVQFTTGNTAWLKPATEYSIITRFKATDTYNAGSVTTSITLISGKWKLTESGLSASPASNWKFGTEITATGTTGPAEAAASLVYQWYRNNDAIGGANTNKYTPVAEDIDKTLKVVLTVGGSYEWDASFNREVSGTVGKADGPLPPATPSLSGTSHNSITVYSTAKNEYARVRTPDDAFEWIEGGGVSTGFHSLLPNTTYYIYTRVKETDTQKASEPCVTPLIVTTDKQPVTGSVSIYVFEGGDAEWGKSVKADVTNITPAAAVPFLRYDWYVETTPLQMGPASSYPLLEAYVGQNMTLKLSIGGSYTIPTAIQSNSIMILGKTISGTAAIGGLADDGAEWGGALTADVIGVLPAAAQASIAYSWSVGGIEKATTSGYTPASADIGSTLTLTLSGSGSYRGTVSTTAAILKKTVTAKPTVSGSPTFGSTISASLDAIPADAQTGIGYQWYRSATETGTGTAITGATGSTYVVGSGDIDQWLYVEVTVASGNALYRGVTRSAAVEGGKEIISAIIGITGSAKFGQELTITVGSLAPPAATYDVIWYREGTEIKRGDGTVAANKKYTPVLADIGKVISATIIGTGNYTGTPTAAVTATVTKADGPAKPAAPTAVSNTYNTITVTGLAGYAYKLDSGSWGDTRAASGSFDLTGLNPNTAYSVYCYIPETDTHLESVSSDAAAVTTLKQPITGSVSFTGTLTYGQTLTADISGIAPASAQAGLIYAWYRGDTALTTGEATGITTSTYTLGEADIGKYIELRVTATGDYTGNMLKISVSPVSKASASAPETPTLNNKSYNSITVNSVATNQYAITQTLGGTLIWQDGGGSTTSFNSLSPNKTYYVYARVKGTATHNASDPCATPLTATTDKQPIGGTVAITGTAEYGETLTAVITGVTPTGAQSHLTYQWYRVDSGVPEAIGGAISQTYVVGPADIGLTLRVRVTAGASSDYIGYVDSGDTATIEKKTITGSVSITGGAYFGDTLSVIVTNVTPAGSQPTLKYQWQRYKKIAPGLPGRDAVPPDWIDIVGATNSTYTVTGDDIGMFGGEPIMLRVLVTGDDVNFIGTVSSGSVTPGKKVISGTISITGTIRFGSTVTASASVIPGAAESDMGYRWFIDGVSVGGRIAATFDIDDSAWIGKTLTVEKYVSAPGSNYTGSVASAGVVILKTANPGTTAPVQVLSFNKTSITIKVVPGQVYSIDGGSNWTDSGFDGVFGGLTPGMTYTILTKIPGSDTVEDSAVRSLNQQTQPDAVSITYEFYAGITGTVIVPSSAEIGTQVTVRVIAPDGYRLTEIFDASPVGVKLTPIGNDSFTFVAGNKDIWLFIVFTSTAAPSAPTSSVTTSVTSSASSAVTSKPSSVTSAVSQVTSETGSAGSDISAPDMGMGGAIGNSAGIAIALFGLLGIAVLVIMKRKLRA